MRVTPFHAVFATVVVLCLAQVTWWTIFHGQEAARLEDAGTALGARDVDAALRILGAREGHSLADEANRRFVMFASEGAALSLVILIGVVTFFVMLRQRWQLVADQERFLEGATHAWRTPLASLRLGLESFAAGRVPEQKRSRYLAAMLGEVDRLDHDVSNLLAAARLSRPGPISAGATGDLRDDVTRAAESLRMRAEAQNVALVLDTETATVVRNEEAITMVIQNLIDNAVKYSKPNGRVVVRLRREDKVADLTVTDDGVGMTSEDLDQLFVRFKRGSAKDHAGGTGLGLWIAKEIVRSHRGTISAQSEGRERGTTLRIRLPLARNGS